MAVHWTTRLVWFSLCAKVSRRRKVVSGTASKPEHGPPGVWKQLCPGTHEPCLKRRESSAVFSVRSSPLNQNKHSLQTLEEDASAAAAALISPRL